MGADAKTAAFPEILEEASAHHLDGTSDEFCPVCRQLAKLCQLAVADLSNTVAILELGPDALSWQQYAGLRRFAAKTRTRAEQARARLAEHRRDNNCVPDS